ncbi:hypothetical protein [Escherichia phage vB-Eco-KMB41]|nr:hypothetical protein [Escherichia phage vB-Eco-KMB41]
MHHCLITSWLHYGRQCNRYLSPRQFSASKENSLHHGYVTLR